MTPPDEEPAGREWPRLVLASTSPYRRALLERLALPFDSIDPGWKEVRRSDPDETVRENAVGKARAGGALRPDAWILASDQVGYCDGQILEKPGTPVRAIEQLQFLSGREHTLHTGVVLRSPDGLEEIEIVVAHLRMRPLRLEQIEAYVRREAPLDCAGSYKSEALGILLFDSLRCDDPTAIVGLPLIATRRLLEAAGLDPLDLLHRRGR
ncbi:MAG: nucleoside triphosphate pyrophosphatase [Candidatus Eisenbacteria bacterium]|nr:nucleoside triphosphate pyrophosphatase [Candidatus Eisenbacteria bacterium]